jgi:purine-nucleoside phosphorylase
VAILNAKAAAAVLRRFSSLKLRLAMVLGSGFADVLSGIEGASEVPYDKIPGFALPQVPGHLGRLVFGTVCGVPLVGLLGRGHFYEGLTLKEVTFPVRVLAELGIEDLLLTNAAGGINPRYRPGDFVAVTDHINLMGANPLRGSPAFIDLSEPYDPRLIRMLQRAAKKARVRLHQGVYLAVSGPSYETPAEIHAFRTLGADMVGMSTVPETIVARQCGMRVAGLSCITNLAAGRSRKPLSHEDVLAVGKKVQKTATDLLRKFLILYANGQ